MSEVWDLYDKNRNLTGKTHLRGKPIPSDYYHLVVHVWIVNKKGQFLVSQRSETRPTFALMWECVGGSVVQGENSFQGALRETIEEVGIALNPENGKIIYQKTRINDHLDAWLFNYDGEVDLTNATTDEVCQTKWVTKEQLFEIYKLGNLVPTLEYIFEINN